MLSQEQIEELKQFDTPTICNAIESFHVRRRTEGIMDYTVRQIVTRDKPLVGYAATAKISAMHPARAHQEELKWLYYEMIRDAPKPTISIIQDIDTKPVGSYWGDLQANIHMALGCDGAITNGGVRDIDELNNLGFQMYASQVLVSHAYVHVEDYNCPVDLGGLTVRPLDLIHADKHGVCIIPQEIADRLADACRRVFKMEEDSILYCREAMASGQPLNLKVYREKRTEMNKRQTETFG